MTQSGQTLKLDKTDFWKIISIVMVPIVGAWIRIEVAIARQDERISVIEREVAVSAPTLNETASYMRSTKVEIKAIRDGVSEVKSDVKELRSLFIEYNRR